MPTYLRTPSRKKKIEILFPFCGDRLGGSHISTLELIKHLDKKKFKVSVICFREGKLVPFLEKQGVPCQTPAFSKSLQNSIFRKMQMGFDLISAIRLCRRNRSCIIHCNELYIKMLFALPGRIFCKNVWHQRTMVTSEKLRWFMPYLCSKIVCVSQSVYHSLSPLGRSKATVVYNPVSVTPPKEKNHSQRLVRKKCVVGLASRMVAKKGIEVFLQGALDFLRQKKRIRPLFVIAGEGALQEKINRLIINQSQIRIIPFCHPVENFIRRCRVLVAPSLEEGFGRTLVEAMLCKVPVLASDIPAHREISRNGAFARLVKPNCPKSLVKGLSDLLRKKPTARQLLQACRFAKSRFSPRRHGQIMQKVYQQILAH